jgi:predicted CxxxxCH...CXXCH cytochrome family protein
VGLGSAGIVMGLKIKYIVLCGLVALVGCSDVKNAPTGPTTTSALSVHTPGWITPSASDFHGVALAKASYDMSGCRTCHGEDYTGGITESSCIKCHPGTPEDCSTCHGQPPAEPHPQVANCSLCHGHVVDETGTIVDASLHINGKVDVRLGHPQGFASPMSENFHGFAIKAANWSMAECQSCHGQDYRGGVVSDVSCLTCHQEGPEDCATCHGDMNNPAPPEDLAGNTTTDLRGVGAHQTHLSGGFFGGPIDCAECHNVPTHYLDPGHIDSDVPAEVIFGSLATTGGRSPVWDGESCSNTYCHNVATPTWTLSGAGQSICSTCHAIPPPAPHPQLQVPCSTCHPRVVDENLIIIDKTLHINGQVEVGQ